LLHFEQDGNHDEDQGSDEPDRQEHRDICRPALTVFTVSLWPP
jgi:hypothetical protein